VIVPSLFVILLIFLDTNLTPFSSVPSHVFPDDIRWRFHTHGAPAPLTGPMWHLSPFGPSSFFVLHAVQRSVTTRHGAQFLLPLRIFPFFSDPLPQPVFPFYTHFAPHFFIGTKYSFIVNCLVEDTTSFFREGKSTSALLVSYLFSRFHPIYHVFAPPTLTPLLRKTASPPPPLRSCQAPSFL